MAMLTFSRGHKLAPPGEQLLFAFLPADGRAAANELCGKPLGANCTEQFEMNFLAHSFINLAFWIKSSNCGVVVIGHSGCEQSWNCCGSSDLI
jgi:hypothetical protein